MKKLITALILLSASLARAETLDVTVGPITASGMPGDPVDFVIAYDGPLNVNGVSFNILYPADSAFTPVFRVNSLTAIQCLTAPDLMDVTTSAVLIPGKIAFTVLGLDLSTGPIPFGRTGVLGTCKFTIAADAQAGLQPLTCDTSPGATTASDVNAASLPATCLDGTLRIIIPPTATRIPNTPVDTATMTPTSTEVPSDTPVPSETPVATGTAVPATETPAPVSTDTVLPLPTETPLPVSTATAVNTDTPVATATVSVSSLQQLIALVDMSGLPDGVTTSLTSTLYAAIDQVSKGHLTPACNQVDAFLNKVAADRDASKLPVYVALAFVDGARNVRSQLGCERPR